MINNKGKCGGKKIKGKRKGEGETEGRKRKADEEN